MRHCPERGGGGEDFHFYKKAKPELRVLYYGIGSGAAPGLHDRNMNFNEAILPQAMAMLKGIMAIRPPNKAVWAGRPISKRARDILELLGINNKFPQNLKG